MKKVLTASIVILLAQGVVASAEDELTSLSYISYLERYATVQPANAEESIEAVINMPLVAGDRVDTAREARMEVVLADGNSMWLDEYTTVSFDAVAFSRDAEAERTVIYLADGTIMVEVSEHALDAKPTRIDGRGATVYLEEPGLYRLLALPSGGLRVEVMQGLAEAATTAGGVLVRSETAAEVGAGEVQRSEGSLTWNDDFAIWVQERREITAGESSQHVDLRYSRQAAQLDNYGSWVYVDSINSWAWQPTVGGSWQPYQAGRWYWTPTGYAWISYEPWGWLPYHYGSWHFDVGFGWLWSWGGYWGPAWVSWIRYPGYVGWCPYGYYNSWYWNHYGGGYYPPYYPPYRPPYPGGGTAQPRRRDVMPPPRTASGRVGGDATTSRLATDQNVDISGRVRLAEVDRRGWTVVPENDFTNPDLARIARPGERAIPTDSEQTGVVMTGPLTTRPPSLASPRSEIDRVFRDVERRNTTDVSPLLARNETLQPEVARSLVRPTTVEEVGGRTSDAAVGNRQTPMPTLSTSASSPFSTRRPSRISQPNRYRPTMYSDPPSTSSLTGRTGGSRQIIAPRSTSGRSSLTRPVVVPPTSSSVGSRSAIPSGSSRSLTGRTRSGSSSTMRRPSGSTAPRSSTVGRSRSSSPSRSSVGRTRSSSPSSRSSASSSRPSSGRSSASRPSSSSSSSSSSGARKR
jgi:hypothetical protein